LAGSQDFGLTYHPKKSIQKSPQQWGDFFLDQTLADAILDRLLCNSFLIDLAGLNLLFAQSLHF
jgi:hypothetical protein